MLSKSARAASKKRRGERNLRSNISDLFLSGSISAARARGIFQDAADAQARHVNDLVVSEDKNIHRNLLRKLVRGSAWPKPYIADITMYDPHTHNVCKKPIAVYLPHEIHWCLLRWNGSPEARQRLLDWQSLRRDVRERVASSVEALTLDPEALVAWGLWCDGVPVRYDRSESLECFSLNPLINETFVQTFRLPLTCIYKSFCCKDGRTVDDLMAIFAHSFHCMREGIFPEVDFQGQPFKSSWRRKMAGRPLLAQGILAEVRGDWAMYKQVFKLPSWNAAGRCCFKCKCSLQEIRSCSSSAPWRDHPWSFLELQEHMLDKSGAVSPIMAAPGISLATFEVDWLHSCDLGVAADFLGNCCFLVSKHMPGSSEEQRVASLWRDIKQWYTENQTPNQFNTITKLMIRKEARKSPKLRGKAAEIRYLIPWSVDITERLFSGYPPSSEEGACRLAAKQIQICYSQLSTENFDPKVLADSCKSFLLLYTALEDLCLLEHRWRYKPKFHLWQHMCESTQSAPSLYWTYDDEDWGGSLGRMSVRRGGKHVALGLSKTVLTKFAAQNKVPSLADLALREKSTAPFCEHFACCLCKGA